MNRVSSRWSHVAIVTVVVALGAACTTKTRVAAPASPTPTLPGSASPSTTRIPGSPTPIPVPPLVFKGCGGGFDCANMSAPLDYAKPTGAHITIAVIRHHAKGSNGTLVINPGGPGASGVDVVRYGLPQVSALQHNKDIVSFDPRGTGASTNIGCGTHIDAFLATDNSPDNPDEVNQLKAVSRQLADECLARGGRALLTHVTTVDTARDMDLLRAALGLPKLDYLGYSYGTLLGAIYAELFPSRVGRFVLDGVLDPKLTTRQIEEQQGIAFEDALSGLLASCEADSKCPFKANGSSSLGAEYDRLNAQLDSTPLPTGQSRQLTQALFNVGVAGGLYDRANGWDAIKRGLGKAQRGDGSGLLALSDVYSQRRSDGSYPTTLAAMYAVNCTDRPQEDLATTAAQVRKRAPRMGPWITWVDMPCVVWPVPATDKAHVLKVPSSLGSHVLIIGTTRDPATPYVNSVSLHDQMKGSSLLTYDGDGHTATGRNDCVDRLVSAWLIDGTLPADGSRC